MNTLRVFFAKTGRAAYISHLDLSRAMQRAFKRAALPVWYTEGFNPHIYLTFALPLSLGYQGLRESMDLKTTESLPCGEWVSRLNAALPNGLRALDAAQPVMPPEAIAAARYRLTVALPGVAAPEEALSAFLAQSVIEVTKSTKKGKITLDIKPDLLLESVEQADGALTLTLFLPAGPQKNINPGLVLDGLSAYANAVPRVLEAVRLAVFTETRQLFA